MEGEAVARKPNPDANPKRIAAGKLSYRKRKGLTPGGLERLRAAALAGKPWLHSTGPKSPEGKARSAANGKFNQKNAKSVRERRAERAGFLGLAREMAAVRNGLAGVGHGGRGDG